MAKTSNTRKGRSHPDQEGVAGEASDTPAGQGVQTDRKQDPAINLKARPPPRPQQPTSSTEAPFPKCSIIVQNSKSAASRGSRTHDSQPEQDLSHQSSTWFSQVHGILCDFDSSFICVQNVSPFSPFPVA